MEKVVFKKILILTLITSIALGVFGLLPAFIFIHASPLVNIAADGQPAPRIDFTLSIFIIIFLMISLWLINIALYIIIEKVTANYKKRNLIRYVTSYIVTLLFLFIYSLYLKDDILSIKNRFFLYPFIAAISNNTIIIIILDLILLQQKKSQIELEFANVKVNNLIAQQSHLKQQLHPHFLFNSLNTLKSLIKKRPAEAEEYLIRLSGLLRSSLNANIQNTTGLKDELRLCIDYMEMQKVRFNNSLSYNILIPEDIIESVSVPVLSLQLLIENAIKHNILTEEEPLIINIAYNNEGYIVVNNNKLSPTSVGPSSAIGLKNLSDRYKMISGHDIKITNSDSDFTVEIKALSL